MPKSPCKACGIPTASYTGFCRRRGPGHEACMKGHNSARWHSGGETGLSYVGVKPLVEGDENE